MSPRRNEIQQRRTNPSHFIVVEGAGLAALSAATAYPDLRIIILAPTWREVDDTRALAVRYGDRVTVHHRSSRVSLASLAA